MAGGPSDDVKRGSAQRDTSHDIVDSWHHILANFAVVALVAATVWLFCTAIRVGVGTGSAFIFGAFDAAAGHGGDHGGHPVSGWQADFSAPILVAVIMAGALARGLLLRIPSWRPSEGDGMGASLEAFHKSYWESAGEPPGRYGKSTIGNACRRVVLTVLTIGTGGSGGSEAPVVPIGEHLGAFWSKTLRVMRHDDLRIYQMAGIAAAVSTLLEAPVTAAIFAAEVVYNARILYRTLMYSLIGAVVAYALNNHFLDMQPLFQVSGHGHSYTPLEYLEVAAVALAISAPAGLGITALFTFLKTLIHPLAPLARPLVGAAVVAAIGLSLWYGLGIEPRHVMGVSEETIVEVIGGTGNPLLQVWWVLLVLVFAKAVATGFTLMAGGSAGALVPAMYMGGVSGAAMFHLLNLAGLTTLTDPGLYVVAGLCSALVAVVQVPLAAIVFSMEAFGAEFGPPAIVACVITYKLARRWRLYLTPPPPAQAVDHT